MANFPAIHTAVFRTANSVPYLKEPGVVMLSKPEVNLGGLTDFLGGFDPSLEFSDYLDDQTPLPPAELLCKVAAQLCYMSLGPQRTKNDRADVYFGNIKSSGHGSVLEHANFTFLFYGVSRSLTHELVRHRAGFGYSQVSQRYVSGKVLRFVERPEYQGDDYLHELFLNRIDRVSARYEAIVKMLMEKQKEGEGILSAEGRTDLRKKVQQTARSLLPNETEAPIVVTANVRAWRHFIEMRASEHAETEIRELAFRVFLCLREVSSIIFGDYAVEEFGDGTRGVSTAFRKI